jgi:two-component system CheB/CheR fusion protein
MATKAAGSPLRVWVPGCSTGEEVYSLAICVLELLAISSLPVPPIQFFGTDLNPQAIASARVGLYPPGALGDLSAARLDHFFLRVNGSYQIRQDVRERCVFAQHNLLKDPPFSHLDLLSCQNVLIYLGLRAQKKILQSFHYALAPHGVLLLGPSETIGTAVDLFAPLGRHKRQWYRTKAGSAPPLLAGGIPRLSRGPSPEPGEEGNSMVYEEEKKQVFDLRHETERLLARFAPASVVIDAQMEILHFRGDTSPYLGPAPGRASLNLFKMARAGLDLELRTALSKVRKSGLPVKKAGVHLRDHDILRDITIEVLPLNASATERYFVILFAEASAPSPDPATSVALGGQRSAHPRSRTGVGRHARGDAQGD